MNSRPPRLYELRSPQRLELSRRGPYLDFGDSSISRWCLDLSLMAHDLVEVLTVTEEGSGRRVEFIAGMTDRTTACGDETLWQISLCPSDVLSMVQFFLLYYRDGVAPEEHLDFEAEDPCHSRSVSVVFRVGRFVSRSVSAKELLED